MTSRILSSILALAAAGLLASSPIFAAQSLDGIRQTAVDFLTQHFVAQGVGNPSCLSQQVRPQTSERCKLVIEARRLDSRLRLQECSQTLQGFLPPGNRLGANMAVGVRCPSGNGWSLYVPMNLQWFKKILVAADSLPKKVKLTLGNTRLEERDVLRLRNGYLSNATQAVGKILKRPVSVGDIIVVEDLDHATRVRRGDRVTLISRGSGVSVSAYGIAAGEAVLGETVKVKNERSKRIVEGRVTGAREVTIGI